MRIAVTTDLCRTPVAGLISVSENVRWVCALLRSAVQSSGIEVTEVLGLGEGGTVDERALFEQHGIPINPTGWAMMTGVDGLESAPSLAPLFKADLVVGFGLTPALLHALARVGIPTFDIELSPLRFGPILPFRARATTSMLDAALAAIAIPAEPFRHAAQALIGRYAHDRPRSGTPRPCGVVFGQTHVDLALVVNRRLVSLEDDGPFATLASLAQQVETLHVVAHPIAANHPSNLGRVLADIPNAVLGERASYAYLASGAARFAAALSSSILTEAPWFGVRAAPLIAPDRDQPSCLPAGMGGWRDVTDMLFAPTFWVALREGDIWKPQPTLLAAPSLADAAFRRFVSGRLDDAPLCAPPRLGPATRYPMLRGTPQLDALRSGWSHPEDWGVWTDGNYASIAFTTNGAQPLVLELEADCYADADIEIKSLGAVGFVAVAKDPDGLVRIPLNPQLSDSLVVVTIRAPAPLSPAAMGHDDNRRLALGLKALTLSPQDMQAGTGRAAATSNSAYYGALHLASGGYLENNWLLPHATMVRALAPRRVVECGCGNGAFLAAIADRVENALGLDWAPSPHFPHGARNIRFQPWDALHEAPPAADLLCSADFLEHIPSDVISSVLERLLSAAPYQLHVVACYDDNHSHLIIEPPEAWLTRFRSIRPECYLMAVSTRSHGRVVATITTIPDV